MDMLSSAERAEVESHVATYPELRTDLREIEAALEVYSSAAALKAPAGLKAKIMDALRDDFVTDTRSGSGPWPLLAVLFGLGLAVVGYLYWQGNNQNTELQSELVALRDTCATREELLNQELQQLRPLADPRNRILPFTPTPGFAATDLYFHFNPATRQNFIQVRNLPDIADNQTFELWSLKTGQAPARMNLFDEPANGIVAVDFIEGTEIYAITIEPEGGVDSPTMANLIGTVSVAGLQQ
jgi:hypothetical protein